MEDMAVLKKMRLFKDLDTLELIQISKTVRHHRFAPGELAIKEGDHGDSLFVVKSGKFRAYVTRQSSKELAQFGPGESFGELALIDAAPRSATIEAMSQGELLELTSEDFRQILSHSNELRERLYENLIKDLVIKLRRTNDKLLHLL
ncbi:MAG: cyclic nucleotide-binding domain-containing protein [Acidobacteria bacterium]|jgi:CRP-like cAMP-binding protein|nr:cyclic nucleotide-binding domain-containing protein [Acidobacteriota bacterium]